MQKIWIAGFLLLSACASVPVAPTPVYPADEVARAGRRVAEGCYTCLLDARDTYGRLSTGPFRAEILPKLFEVQMLLVLRHKELAMPFEEELAGARLLAGEMPASADAGRYVAMVDAVPPDPLGLSTRETRQFALGRTAFMAGAADELTWLAQAPLGSLINRYLDLSIRCADGIVPRGPDEPPLIPKEFPADEPSLLTYIAGTCGGRVDMLRFEVVRTQVPEFHEASYFLARDWFNDALTNGTEKWAAAIEQIQPLFPRASSVSITAGMIEQADGDCVEALRFYEHTLALRPQHERAMLGRVMCLTHLDRSEEAISGATTLIAADGDTLRLAHYWRAWNRHHLGRLPSAREDIDAARAGPGRLDLESRANIHLLAGIIEHDQDDLASALIDLETAFALSQGKGCVAAWYTALVHIKQGAWPKSAVSFETAMNCHADAVATARRGLANLQARTEIDPLFRARRISTLEKAIIDGERQRYASAMNAAKSFANAGDYVTSVRLAAIAMDDPTLAPEVEVLRGYLADRGTTLPLPAGASDAPQPATVP